MKPQNRILLKLRNCRKFPLQSLKRCAKLISSKCTVFHFDPNFFDRYADKIGFPG